MQRSRPAVLDSFALIAFLYKERGYKEIKDLLESAVDDGVTHMISAVNWAEVRAVTDRKSDGSKNWSEIKKVLSRLPIEVVPADQELAELAGDFKARGGISLADCFAAALAKRENARLYNGDPEFKRIESEISIHWL